MNVISISLCRIIISLNYDFKNTNTHKHTHNEVKKLKFSHFSFMPFLDNLSCCSPFYRSISLTYSLSVCQSLCLFSSFDCFSSLTRNPFRKSKKKTLTTTATATTTAKRAIITAQHFIKAFIINSCTIYINEFSYDLDEIFYIYTISNKLRTENMH